MEKIKKIIIWSILGLILAFTLAIAPQKVKADTITNLLDYTWVGNNTIFLTLDEEFYIGFRTEQDGIVYSWDAIGIHDVGVLEYVTGEPETTTVYRNGNWVQNIYKKITFYNDLGDAENTTLISWLQENGTLTKDRTITSGNYRFIDTLILGQTEFAGEVDINFTSNNQNFTGVRVTSDTLYYVNSTNNNEVEVFNIGVGWLVTDSAYQNIIVGTSQDVSLEFYEWFMQNSVLQVYYTITFDRNGATSGELPPQQDVVSGTTFNINNYNPGNLGKENSTFLGWNTDASATTPLSSIVVNSDILLYAIFSIPPKSVNIKITCRDNVVWQGNAVFQDNKIVGGVSWDSPTMTNVFFNSLDSQSIALINDKYGLEPNYANNQLLLFFRPFSSEKDDNGNYLAYVNLIRLTTPKGTYAVNYTATSSPKSINFETWLATEGLTNMLNIDTDNYYFNLEISWSLEEPLPPGVAEWGNVATIMARIMASASTLLSINLGFITLGNLLLIVIALSVLFFIIKVWRGGD